MTVYADILFLVNLSLNWFSLILTSKIVKHESGALKMLAAAALGAIAGVASVFFESRAASAAAEIASSFLMCAVAFRADGFFDYIKICTCLFASGITLGGSLTFIYSLFNRAGIKLPEQNDISAAVFLVLSLFVTLTAAGFERLMFSRRSSERGEVTFTLGQKSLTLPFLCDSGNFLCEPISGKPAVIVCARDLKGFLPDGVLMFDPLHPHEENLPFASRIRLLPASTVCGEKIMPGFIPDSTLICCGKRKKYADAVIALDKSRTNASYAQARAIVPSSLL